MIKITSNKTCEGFADGGEFCGTKTPYRVYFAVEFDREASEKGTWIGNALLKESLHGYGKNSGAYFTFDTNQNNEVQYRIAVSFVSIKNAKENAANEKQKVANQVAEAKQRAAKELAMLHKKHNT